MAPNTKLEILVDTDSLNSSVKQSEKKNNATPTRKGNENPKLEWSCRASAKSVRTVNPIRAIVDPIVSASIKCGKDREDGKDQISLALGDPTLYDNLKPCPILIEAVSKCAAMQSCAGYVNACGSEEARCAISKYFSTPYASLSQEDVVLASGCSGALELALTALLDEGSTLLVPRPGFPLYQVIAESHGANVQHYNLNPARNWECDMMHMEELVLQNRDTVRAIVITNPSNPCGSVFSERHLRDLLKFAERHRLPIVADEVYGDITFNGATFFPLGQLAAKEGSKAPVIAASGLGKQFLVPGWRVGWLTFHDNVAGALKGVKQGVVNLAQVILGASHLVQGCIPAVLDPQSEERALEIMEWKYNLKETLASQSIFTCDKLRACHGLTVFPPMGAMYVMVQLHPGMFDEDISNDIDFTRLLLHEENVFALPGTAFGAPNFFRVVYCASTSVLTTAFNRIADFCTRHENMKCIVENGCEDDSKCRNNH